MNFFFDCCFFAVADSIMVLLIVDTMVPTQQLFLRLLEAKNGHDPQLVCLYMCVCVCDMWFDVVYCCVDASLATIWQVLFMELLAPPQQLPEQSWSTSATICCDWPPEGFLYVSGCET